MMIERRDTKYAWLAPILFSVFIYVIKIKNILEGKNHIITYYFEDTKLFSMKNHHPTLGAPHHASA